MSHITADQDPGTFEHLTRFIRKMDPAYESAIVERVYDKIYPKTDECLLPPEGCLFVSVNLGGRLPKRVLVTVQEALFGAPGAQTEYRMTPEMVDKEIIRTSYSMPNSGKAIICEVTLKNGYTVRGESAVVDVRNFDFDIGARVAHGKAINEVYKVLSFRLQDALHRENEAKGIRTQ